MDQPINNHSTRLTTSLSGPLGRWLDRLQPPTNVTLIGTALVVGVATGLGAVITTYLIRGVGWIGYTWLPSVLGFLGKSYVIFVPAVGGLVAGILIYRYAREAKGHGVPEVMEAVALRGGRIRPIVALIKSVASAFTIGSGGSAGREGPVVQIGSAVGSTLGQIMNLSDDRISNLVACGAAAGISATFNAPIAGVIFALEVILGRFTVRYFSTVVVSAVSASVIGHIAFGDFPAFKIPFDYGVNSLWEFLFYPIMGVFAALIGVLFTRSLYKTEDLFDDWRRVPEWVKPAIGGVLLGVLALVYPLIHLTQPISWTQVPQVFGVGYDLIEAALSNQLALTVVAVLLFAKIIATCLTLGSGGSGGVFAPSLFMGATLGAAFQLVINSIFPGVTAPAGAYALVGMGAVFAAATHAPITGVLILFELTGDYHIILPLMLTVGVATLLSQHLMKGESIYTLKLTRRGIHLRRGRDVDILQGVLVGEVMSKDVETVPVDMTIRELTDLFSASHHHGLMVMDEEGKFYGIVTLTDLEKANLARLPVTTNVGAIATTWPHLTLAYPDETMGDALTRMGARGLGRLPVVSREDPYLLLGLIWREGIIQAYNLALTRRSGIQVQKNHLTSQFEKETDFINLSLVEGDPAVGSTVHDIAGTIPKDCVLVSIRRDGRVIIPHGDTAFEAGDQVTAFLRREDAEQLYQALHGAPTGNGDSDIPQ